VHSRLCASALLSTFALTIGTANAATIRSRAATTIGWAPTATQALSLKSATDFGAVASNLPMHVALGLSANRTAINAAIRAIYTPGSASFHRFVTPAQFTQAFSPSASAAAAVASYLAQAGFTNVAVAPNRLVVTANGSAAVVSRAFNTQIHAYAQAGRAIVANASPAMVPAALAGTVSSVLGLNNIGMTAFHKKSPAAAVQRSLHRLVNGHVKRDVSPCLYPDIPVCALNTYFPTDLEFAYDGAGQPTASKTSMAIFTEGDMTVVKSDLAQALKADGQAPVTVKEVDVVGPFTDTSGTDEWDIDSQSSTAMSGGPKDLTYYVGNSLADDSLTPTFNRWVTDDTIPVANLSVGGCEALEYESGGLAADDLIFAEAVLQGQSLFVSSGDGGSQCSVLVNAGAPTGIPSVEYPASSPYVTAVGGTSLLTNSATGSYYGEITWEDGGGGISIFENASPWQYSNIELAETGKRLVPDLANDADPNVSGMNTVVSGAYAGYGGTSLASPMTMGVYARLQSLHGNSLGVAAASLYADYNVVTNDSLGILPSTSLPTDTNPKYGGFHDIIAGTNTLYDALPGFDLTSGVGTLDIKAIVNDYTK
jgi:subtilase family serine protease